MNLRFTLLIYLLSFLGFWTCGTSEQTSQNAVTDQDSEPNSKPPLFELVPAEHTGIYFNNLLEENEVVNTYNYINSYNGGGVAIGDINNDGKPDIYLTGNTVPNKLYLNKGDLKFEDITYNAGVGGGGGWCTGVTMADVDGNGFLDIYVCRSFNDDDPQLRENILYLNNGDLTFTEKAAEYGINDNNYTTQAVFLDYDLDGDLDLYVANHPRIFSLSGKLSKENSVNPKIEYSDRFFRNNGNNTFTDVTVEAGVLNYGFILGVMSGDINGDGYPDVYVANDHQEPDFYYLNNGDGTFTNAINENLKHISNFSMGMELADFNNDGWLDIFVADMMAEDNYRQKTQMKGMSPETFWRLVDIGYHYQYMRNTLQLNNGNGTFSEVGQLAGIDKTDWSWGTLMVDFDNDGYKDLFVANGFRRDTRDNDYMIAVDKIQEEQGGKMKKSQIFDILDMIPTTKLKNKFFRNNGDLTFSNVSEEAGLTHPSFSNGAAYGDLDGDGDLEIVINNVLDLAFVYENKSNEIDQYHYLRVKLNGEGKNTTGIGTKVTLLNGDDIQYQELTLTRGFQSSVESILHFGLGRSTTVDEIKVQWPNGKVEVRSNITVDQLITFDEINAKVIEESKEDRDKLFVELENSGIGFRHVEDEFDDYEKEILLPHKTSQFGPALAAADVNGDDLDDLYIGGAANQSAALFIQGSNGKFSRSKGPWTDHQKSEDVAATFFDADGDGDKDIYVVSGGNEFPVNSPLLYDRLYINDGNGSFTNSNAIPEIATSGGCVTAADFDKDGDMDLFVGGRLVPGKYPFPANSHILINDNGTFNDMTGSIAPELISLGLVSSAEWTDFNGDGNLDLVVVGEWMAPSFFENKDGKLQNISASLGLEKAIGWWNRIVEADYDADGDPDYVLGNLGLNYKYKVTEEEPLHIYCHDFDETGSLDIVLGYYNQGVCYPVRGRQCTSEQMPFIKTKFPDYDSFGKASIDEVYGEQLNNALHYEATWFSSALIENLGDGKFVLTPLPVEAQFSTIFGIIPEDFNDDGKMDLLIAGNFYVSEVETGRADAGTGLLLLGNGKGNFDPVHLTKSGFFANKDVRNMVFLRTSDGDPIIVVANNNDKPQVFKVANVSHDDKLTSK
ncbi:MAG: VCBS repeat-containing protein [Bacteroidetes bacterium]|nr:VCBS repeat-containing protein [Bacteroidota bacterium]